MKHLQCDDSLNVRRLAANAAHFFFNKT